MKIGIITFSRAKNFGAVLQTYSLYHYLKGYGFDVEVIDYITERCAVNKEDFVERRTSNSRFWGKNKLLKRLWKILYLHMEQQEHEHFFSFLNEHVVMTNEFYSNDELRVGCPQFDIYITGSDQVWNTDFTWDHEIDLPYFLDFVPDNKIKISYASSFGRDSISKDKIEDIQRLLKRYNAISVREESARIILKDIGILAETVMDPTLLCTSDEWQEIAGRIPIQEKKYLLVFLVNANKALVKLAKKLASKYNLDLIVNVSSVKNKRNLNGHASIPSVEKWIANIRDAEFVITDSFHATAFCIQFKKQFLVDGTVKYNTRIINILEKLSIKEQCLEKVEIKAAEQILENGIKYNDVEIKLNELRDMSQKWLISHIIN